MLLYGVKVLTNYDLVFEYLCKIDGLILATVARRGHVAQRGSHEFKSYIIYSWCNMTGLLCL